MTDPKHNSTDAALDASFARLRAATEKLEPPKGLADRLARRAIAPRPKQAVLLQFARPALIVASLAAAASVILAMNVERLVDDGVSKVMVEAAEEP